MSIVGMIIGALGALIGWVLAWEEGFLVGAVLGYLTGAYFDLHRRLKTLQEQLTGLKERVEHKPATESVPDSMPSAPAAGAPATPAPSTGATYPQHQQTTPPPAVVATRDATAESDVPHAPALVDRVSGKVESALNGLVKFFTTGNVVVRVGLVVLFFGVAFLLKYAAQHSMFPVELRLASVAVGGILMLLVGWRLREKRRNYALLIQGGAVGVIYLTLFSAAKFYDFVPPMLAFGLMVALVVLSAALALLQDAKSLALFGAAGGFLAPVLTSTGEGSHVMLFSYYLLLNIGILLIAWYKAWRELNLLGFLFTFVIGASWGINYYRPEFFISTEPFLIAFFVIYVAVSVLFAQRQPPRLKGYVDGTLVFGVPIVAFALQVSLVHRYEYAMAWSAAALGAFYLGLATLLWRRERHSLRLLTEAFLALGVVFATLVIPFALEGEWTAAAWALEGAAMVWIGVKQDRLLARLFAVALQLAAGAMFLAGIDGLAGSIPVLNGVYLGSLAISLAGLFSSYYLQANRQRLINWEQPIALLLFLWGALWWYAAGINEVIMQSAGRYQNSWLLLFFVTSSVIAYWLYRRFQWKTIYYAVMGLLPLAAIVLLAQLVGRGVAHPFADLAYFGWLAAFGFYYFQLWHLEKQQQPLWLAWQHRVAFWLVALVATLELVWAVDKLVAGAGTWAFIMWGLVPAALLALISSSAGRPRWPVARHYADYLSVISLPLVAAMALWSLIASVHVAGDPWPIAYVPVLNPLELAQLVVFLALAHWIVLLRKHSDTIGYRIAHEQLLYGLGALIFFWLNGVVARTLHHWEGLRFDWSVMLDSMLFHASISVVWTLLAMLIAVIASRIQNRKLWFVGAGLLGIVVVKLFVVDLASSGTIERIVSFLVVGIIMLLIGYFSPLPPRSAREEAA